MEDKEYLHMYAEEECHWWYVGMRSIVLSLLPPAFLPMNPLVLDAGCGTGFNMEWLRQQYGASVIGFDYSPHGLDFCRRRGERVLARADAASLPFSNNVFDLVMSFDVLTQLKDEFARSAALGEFQRVLKPGGRLLLRVAAYEWLRSSHDTVIMTYHRYGRSELRNATVNAGLRLLRLTSANTILFPLAAAWRLLKKAGLAAAGSDVRANTRGNNRLNRAMTSILGLEAAILRHSNCNFGFGLSIFLLAIKPTNSDARTYVDRS
jgi:ubiquinone/menaquinone biosynthesis C-methylase UbiE